VVDGGVEFKMNLLTTLKTRGGLFGGDRRKEGRMSKLSLSRNRIAKFGDGLNIEPLLTSKRIGHGLNKFCVFASIHLPDLL